MLTQATMPAWTYSRLDKFETCPKQFHHLTNLRDTVQPPTEHTMWGQEVHTAFEHFILEGTALPESMQHWQGIADKIAALPGEKLAEHKLAIDRNFKPAPWGESWSRGIGDLLVKFKEKVISLDYKTGKRKPTEQLQLYAGYVFAHWPETEVVETGFVWLKEKKITKETFTRADVPRIWQQFLPRVRKLESAYERDAWPAKPSGLCRGWCPVKTCTHYKDK